MVESHALRVVAGKITPPALDPNDLVRPRLHRTLDADAPCTVVSAMPGAGKSVAVRHWFDTVADPAAWVSVDDLDAEPSVFWAHLLAAVDAATDDPDPEPALLLAERGPSDRLFLAALITRLERGRQRITIVLDGVDQHLDQTVVDGLALLVDRVPEAIRLVLTTQVDPALPLGRWNAAGWLHEVRADALRLTDDEAGELADRLGSDIDADAAARLNRAVDGWPLAVRLALASGWRPGGDDPGGTTLDRSVAAHLTDHLLSRLSPHDRDAALSLSVLGEFDGATCLEFVGPQGASSVKHLLLGPLLAVVDDESGTMRFQPFMRRLLEAELGRTDPVRRTELHRRAAALHRGRGDLRAAHTHLTAIGEIDRSRQMLVDTAFDVVDRGDLRALRRLAGRLPAVVQVDDAELALELGLVAAWGEGTAAARRWCGRAGELVAGGDFDEAERAELRLAVHRLSASIDTLDADLSTAAELASHTTPPSPRTARRFELHVAFIIARSLLAGRHPARSDWIDRVARVDGPPIVTHATVPTLRAWSEWMDGRLRTASELAEQAVAWLDGHHVDAHHWGFDTAITAGWCRLSAGDIDGARTLAERALDDAESLPCHWNRLQATYLAARAALVAGDPGRALELVDHARHAVPFGDIPRYSDRLVQLSAESLIALGRVDHVAAVIDELAPGPGRSLLRVQVEPMSDARVLAELDGADEWPALIRIQASVLLATRVVGPAPEVPDLADVVAAAGEDGWVLPFLGLGRRAEQALRALPLERLHPTLHRALESRVSARSDATEGLRLTPREQSLLELLPTHLSYADMGDRLYLSVNTIKSSLKGLYRKLGAHTRAEAVAAGRALGLI